MALRNLAVKMRIPASAAPRLLSPPRVLPASGSRAIPFSSSSSRPPYKIARDWYLVQRARYDDVTTAFTDVRRVAWWTGKLDHFLRRLYLLSTPLAAGSVVFQWIDYQKTENARE